MDTARGALPPARWAWGVTEPWDLSFSICNMSLTWNLSQRIITKMKWISIWKASNSGTFTKSQRNIKLLRLLIYLSFASSKLFVLFCFNFYFLATPCGTWDVSSLTRDQTRVPCLGAWHLNHWTARKVSPSCNIRNNSKTLFNVKTFQKIEFRNFKHQVS